MTIRAGLNLPAPVEQPVPVCIDTLQQEHQQEEQVGPAKFSGRGINPLTPAVLGSIFRPRFLQDGLVVGVGFKPPVDR